VCGRERERGGVSEGGREKERRSQRGSEKEREKEKGVEIRVCREVVVV
jgi:hypothetical protein